MPASLPPLALAVTPGWLWAADFDLRKSALPIQYARADVGTPLGAREVGLGDNPALHAGTVYGVLATAFAVVGWLLWSMARRVGRADALNQSGREAQEAGWGKLVEGYETRVEKLERQNERLTASLIDQSNANRRIAELETRLAQVGAEKDRNTAELAHARRRVDEVMGLLKASNGGFAPPAAAPTDNPGFPAYV